jgi:hypothetical protein
VVDRILDFRFYDCDGEGELMIERDLGRERTGVLGRYTDTVERPGFVGGFCE